MSYYNQLTLFLKEAKANNLKTKHYDSEYLDTNVKVSFGQGTPAKVPWISFLKEPNTTSEGIYPVYLYYKQRNILILAYGISETNEPSSKWDIENPITINKYFHEKYSKKPYRYGASYIFEVYDTNDLPTKEKIDQDLAEIIEEYHAIESNQKLKRTKFPFKQNTLIESLSESGLQYKPKFITRFTASLLTKPFVILTGLSGSGKTKLAQAFVQWICQDKSQYRMVPVGSDWTNREPLLGYPDALNPEQYVTPDSDVLDLIQHARKNPNSPHFLVLDEMNLSRVERYFADFLSAMESNEQIPLYSGKERNGVPNALSLPSNLFIIGTVNVDETTSMFSPKVLDRANAIEFRVAKKEMSSFLNNMKEVNMDVLQAGGAGMAQSFLTMASDNSYTGEDADTIKRTLLEFFDELKKTGAEFGYRSAGEILRLIHQLGKLDDGLSTNEKIDIAIIQKLLPKLHGSRRKLTPVLEKLAGFCITEEEGTEIIKDIFEKEDYDFSHSKYPLSLEKISRMYHGAVDNGFTSFAEA
ncbi:MAG TPA: DUF3578 domain-containing protein [Fodinibius sp.]|nr:DUF3578 domain-containing protein [Fodinibius sp.]